jgi:hypothetical protein
VSTWTPDELAELERLRAEGLNNAEIGRRLGRSRHAVLRAPNLYRPKTGERNTIVRRLANPDAIEAALAKVYDDFEALGKAAKRSKPPKVRRGQEKVLAEISAPDLHIGKLAWAPETNWGHYDVRLAEEAFTDAIDALVMRVQSQPEAVERVLFPIGNDLVQTDNLMGTTTSGTYVDSDSRYIKSFRRACALMQWAIDRLTQVAPVHALIVPGNHDRLTAFHVGDVLHAYYRQVAEVTIDNRPTLRKYVRYGTCLLGFTHGSEEKEADLPLIMANEAADEWPLTNHREWHIGHFHKMRERRFTAGDSFGGVRVRVLPALCAPDAWHAMRGYVGELRAAEAYLWSERDGYVGHFAHTLYPDRSGE